MKKLLLLTTTFCLSLSAHAGINLSSPACTTLYSELDLPVEGGHAIPCQEGEDDCPGSLPFETRKIGLGYTLSRTSLPINQTSCKFEGEAWVGPENQDGKLKVSIKLSEETGSHLWSKWNRKATLVNQDDAAYQEEKKLDRFKLSRIVTKVGELKGIYHIEIN